MSLLKKSEKAKPLRSVGVGGGVGMSAARPRQLEKLAPCLRDCPSGNDIRGWITILSQRNKTGLSFAQACEQAWLAAVRTNPFPAIMGRVCPHPCEGDCNRKGKEGSVAINAVERFIGDWGLEHGLALPMLSKTPNGKKVAVVGAGPAGLSCAYQLAQRGYGVTVFDSLQKPGGMLRYGIPDYRLPREILDGEINRILQLGVELRCNARVGGDVSLESLQRDYAAVFVAIGAHTGKKLGIPGEDGPGVYAGTDFLRRVSMGDSVTVGKKVIIVGGGDTAVDAARVCLRLGTDAADVSRRLGAEVTILYRRTRAEMPAIEDEILGALDESVRIEFLAAPVELKRGAGGAPTKLVVQRMRLGDPDASGRRAPVPIEGDKAELDCDTLIPAVSQEPDFKGLGGPLASTRWLEADTWGRTKVPSVWSGGDNVGLGLATIAIGQGRRAAEAIDASLRGEEVREPPVRPAIDVSRLKFDYYEARTRARRRLLGVSERLQQPHREITQGFNEQQLLDEIDRCMSCGFCFGCERCWMFCTPACFAKLPETKPGSYYRIKLETCDGCRKCADECPCGYLDMV